VTAETQIVVAPQLETVDTGHAPHDDMAVTHPVEIRIHPGTECWHFTPRRIAVDGASRAFLR
jgi:hypothetical protein